MYFLFWKWGYSSYFYVSWPKGLVTTFKEVISKETCKFNVPSASFMKFKISSFNFPHVFYRKSLHFSSSLVGSSPKMFGTENLIPPPPHQTLVVGRASSVWKVRPVAWNVTPMRPWMTFGLPGPLPSTVVSLTFPMGFDGIESPTSLGKDLFHSPYSKYTPNNLPRRFFSCAQKYCLRLPCLCQQQKEASLQDTTGHGWFDQKICWKIWRKSSNWRSFWTWKPCFSPSFFFVSFSMVKRAVPIGNNPKYVFAILQGDSNRIEFLAELNASEIMILLSYQVPSSRYIFMWSWWLLQ